MVFTYLLGKLYLQLLKVGLSDGIGQLSYNFLRKPLPEVLEDLSGSGRGLGASLTPCATFRAAQAVPAMGGL